MGNLFTNVFGKLFSKNKVFNILILGLANAGKTTLLYQMYFSLYEGHLIRQYKQRQRSAAMYNKLRTRT